MAIINTERLQIRELLSSDAVHFFLYMKQQEYWINSPIEVPTRESVCHLIEQSLLDQSRDPRVNYLLAAVLNETGQVVGEASLRITGYRRHRQAEIGWGVDSALWRRGLGTEIGEAMLSLAFDQLSLHRVFAQCSVNNTASLRIMSKLGMTREGTLRESLLARSTWWTLAQYSILRKEYGRIPQVLHQLP